MDCPFCQHIDTNEFDQSSKYATSFPDAFPIAPGHTLVVPHRHVRSIFDLTAEEYADLWTLVRTVRSGLDTDGANVGINDGAAAGQTVFHGHVHVIPRRQGDTKDPRGGVRRVFPERAKYWKD